MNLQKFSAPRLAATTLAVCATLLTTCVSADGMDRELYSDRAEVRQFIDEMVQAHGFDAARLTDLFAATPQIPKVIQLIKPPADPGIRSWATYRQRFIEPVRIKAGKKFMARYATELARAEARYGVPREIIAGVIGVETIYGKHTGNFGTFAALTTLAFDYPPRAELFRKELRELLLLARSEKRPVADYRGSFAGALGLPQFLPSSIRAYAVDFDGDGHIDLQASAADAIGSVANYLSSHGWERDQPVAATVSISGDPLSTAIAEGIEPKQTVADWEARGLQLQKVGGGGTALEELRALPAAVIDLVTPNAATEYRLGFRNFYAITRYNRSTFYASAVMDLAQALK
jgi:membrane-bound lytic murein transglycosylase B